MKIDQMLKEIEKIPAGQFFRVRYVAHPTIKAAYRKEGISIIKIVDITSRTGVSYGSVMDPANFKDNTEVVKENNWEWKIPNKVKFNTHTMRAHLVLAPISKGSHAKATYVLSSREGTMIIDEEQAREYIIDSYFKKEPGKVITVGLDNILCLNYK